MIAIGLFILGCIVAIIIILVLYLKPRGSKPKEQVDIKSSNVQYVPFKAKYLYDHDAIILQSIEGTFPILDTTIPGIDYYSGDNTKKVSAHTPKSITNADRSGGSSKWIIRKLTDNFSLIHYGDVITLENDRISKHYLGRDDSGNIIITNDDTKKIRWMIINRPNETLDSRAIKYHDFIQLKIPGTDAVTPNTLMIKDNGGCYGNDYCVGLTTETGDKTMWRIRGADISTDGKVTNKISDYFMIKNVKTGDYITAPGVLTGKVNPVMYPLVENAKIGNPQYTWLFKRERDKVRIINMYTGQDIASTLASTVPIDPMLWDVKSTSKDEYIIENKNGRKIIARGKNVVIDKCKIGSSVCAWRLISVNTPRFSLQTGYYMIRNIKSRKLLMRLYGQPIISSSMTINDYNENACVWKVTTGFPDQKILLSSPVTDDFLWYDAGAFYITSHSVYGDTLRNFITAKHVHTNVYELLVYTGRGMSGGDDKDSNITAVLPDVKKNNTHWSFIPVTKSITEKYKLGPLGSTSCPDNYSHITSLQSCDEAQKTNFANKDIPWEKWLNYKTQSDNTDYSHDQAACSGSCGAQSAPKNCFILKQPGAEKGQWRFNSSKGVIYRAPVAEIYKTRQVCVKDLSKKENHAVPSNIMFTSSEYKISELGSDSCPTGYKHIDTLTDCEDAKNKVAPMFKTTWYLENNKDLKSCSGACGAQYMPKHCWFKDGYNKNMNAIWSFNSSTGKTSLFRKEGSRQVCKKI